LQKPPHENDENNLKEKRNKKAAAKINLTTANIYRISVSVMLFQK